MMQSPGEFAPRECRFPSPPLSSWRKPGPIATGLNCYTRWNYELAPQQLPGVMGPGFRQDDVGVGGG
jgi:hypothetical protein